MTKFLSRNYLEHYFEFVETSSDDEDLKNQSASEITADNNIIVRKIPKIPICRLFALQLESAWALTNVASGTTDHTRYIISLKCIERMVDLLDCGRFPVMSQAVWGIGNFAGDSPFARDLALKSGAIKKIVQAVREEKFSLFDLHDLKNGKFFLMDSATDVMFNNMGICSGLVSL